MSGQSPLTRSTDFQDELQTPGGAPGLDHVLARRSRPALRSETDPNGDVDADRTRTTASRGRRQERQEGQGMPRGIPAPGRKEPLEGKPQERRRYETRPAGSRAEEGVKGLRKPEDAAQPGQASPAPVAARYLMRCRGRNPRRVCPPATARCSARRACAGERSDSGHTLQPSEAHERIRLESIHSSRPGPTGTPRRPTPQGEEAREGSPTSTAIPRTSARL
jgi:hypothetical protein